MARPGGYSPSLAKKAEEGKEEASKKPRRKWGGSQRQRGGSKAKEEGNKEESRRAARLGTRRLSKNQAKPLKNVDSAPRALLLASSLNQKWVCVASAMGVTRRV